jgi:hypothetical protein
VSSGYRSWEEREADAAKTRAEADRLQAETAAISQAAQAGAARTETEQIAERVKQARLLKQLTAVEADAVDDASERKEKRAEARLDKGVAFKQLVTALVIAGLLASLPSLIAYFLGLRAEGKPDTGPAFYLLSVPFFLELLAWTSVKGTQWAVRRGFARWPFWILTLVLAGFAGFINGTKGAEMFGPIAGWALASTSIFGPVLWEVREYIEARTAADNRSVAERAAEKAAAKAKATAEKIEAARVAKQDQDRKTEFPDEYAEYRRIMIAHPLGMIDRDEAWARAWDNKHRLPLAQTALTLASRADAQDAIDTVMTRAGWTVESLAVEQFLRNTFGSTEGDEGPSGAKPDRTPKGGTGGGFKTPQRGSAEAPEALGRKGKQLFGRTTAKTPQKPLDPADLIKVRKLAEALGGTDKLSTRNVREVLGGGSNEYVVRARDAVKNPEGEQ